MDNGISKVSWLKDFEDENEIKDKPKVTFSNAATMTPRAPFFFINNILESDSHGLMFGSSGSFKSFMALEIARSICTGSDFFGQRVFETGKVIYICGEGQGALSRRIHAINVAKGGFGGNLWVLDQKIRIDNSQDIAEVNVFIQDIKPALVIFDTFSSMISVTNENDNSQVAAVLGDLQRALSNKYTSSIIIHHCGKSQDKGARGASAFVANSDFVLSMDRVGDKESMQAVMECKKMKDGEDFAEIKVSGIPIDLGILRQDGSVTESLILESDGGLMHGVKKKTSTDIVVGVYEKLLAEFPVFEFGFTGVCKKQMLDLLVSETGKTRSTVKSIIHRDKRIISIEAIYYIDLQ